MFFRFGSAILLVVLISLAGTAVEKRNLQLRRLVSRQQYRLDVLLEQHATRRVEAQRLGAPIRMVATIDAARREAQAALAASSATKANRKDRQKPRKSSARSSAGGTRSDNNPM